ERGVAAGRPAGEDLLLQGAPAHRVEHRRRRPVADQSEGGQAGADLHGREALRRPDMSLTSSPPSTEGGEPAQSRQLRPQGRKTLAKLLEAGIVVFGERGFHAARVDDIVTVADTSHGTFYLYFSSKEDLFRALVADVT